MKKPKRKTVCFKAGELIPCSVEMDDVHKVLGMGYNIAYDEWEKYHKFSLKGKNKKV